jgi:2'-5' RNA ligase
VAIDGVYRLFVAIAVPDFVQDSIERAQRELRSTMGDRAVRWTKRDQFHLTLKFLGAVESLKVADLAAALRSATANFAPLQLQAAGIGMFPDAQRPRVLWAGVQDRAGRLVDLQRRIQSATASFTAEPSEPHFTGHVTLGRCRTLGRSEARALAASADTMAHRSFGQWTADAIEIVRSELGPAGSRHTVLEALGLGAR